MPEGVVTMPVMSSFSGKNDKYDEEEDGCDVKGMYRLFMLKDKLDVSVWSDQMLVT